MTGCTAISNIWNNRIIFVAIEKVQNSLNHDNKLDLDHEESISSSEVASLFFSAEHLLEEDKFYDYNFHYNLLKRVVKDNYTMGSDVEAIDLLTEDEKRYYFSVKSLMISVTIKDDIIHSVFTYHHDEKGLTTNIHYHVIGQQTNEVPTEVDELIRKNFDYVNNNFDDLVHEFGNPLWNRLK